jgi:hypothetical protein
LPGRQRCGVALQKQCMQRPQQQHEHVCIACLPRCATWRTVCSRVFINTSPDQSSIGWCARDRQRCFMLSAMCVSSPLPFMSSASMCWSLLFPLGVGAMRHTLLQCACFGQKSQQHVAPSCTSSCCVLSSHTQIPHVCMKCKVHYQDGAPARHTTGVISHNTV